MTGIPEVVTSFAEASMDAVSTATIRSIGLLCDERAAIT